jgi:hypothetical protein
MNSEGYMPLREDLLSSRHRGWHPTPDLCRKTVRNSSLHVECKTVTHAILSGWPSPTDSEVKRKVSPGRVPFVPWLPIVEDVWNSRAKIEKGKLEVEAEI